MGVIFDSTEIIALERNRTTVESLVAEREEEPFGIGVVTVAGNRGKLGLPVSRELRGTGGHS